MKTGIEKIRSINESIRKNGLWKNERIIKSPQGSEIISNGKNVINLCANNYLGLSGNSEVIKAAKESYDIYGYGLSSVRFICGTQSVHKQLEKSISDFLKMDDTILYTSCFDANTGLFETLLGSEDAIISDELNHASIIDGVRLCKAQRYRYKNNDMEDLEKKLIEAKDANIRLIATDGVFSMDGLIANLKEISKLAKKYDALLMVDDSHSVGFMGKTGRGTHEYADVFGDVDIITGTLGKALGGASGGYTSARKEIIDLLRQRSRPYLFSNTLAPSIAYASLKVLEMLNKSSQLRDKLFENTNYFRKRMREENFDIIDGTHPIVPIMVYDAKKATKMSDILLQYGIYVIGFFYPVVPMGKARIRCQISAAHTIDQLDYAIDCFIKVRKEIEKED